MAASQPLTANAPKNPIVEETMTIQGNTLIATRNPSLTLETKRSDGVLGVLYEKDDPETHRAIIWEKYPEKPSPYKAGLAELNHCEASGKHEGMYGDNKTSYGGFMYKRDTFYMFCEGDWRDFEDQLTCAVKMIDMGLGSKAIGWKNCWESHNLKRFFGY